MNSNKKLFNVIRQYIIDQVDTLTKNILVDRSETDIQELTYKFLTTGDSSKRSISIYDLRKQVDDITKNIPAIERNEIYIEIELDRDETTVNYKATTHFDLKKCIKENHDHSFFYSKGTTIEFLTTALKENLLIYFGIEYPKDSVEIEY